MKKIIWKEPKEDDPNYKQGIIISQPKIQNTNLMKKTKKMSQRNTIIDLTKYLIKLGWKIIGGK